MQQVRKDFNGLLHNVRKDLSLSICSSVFEHFVRSLHDIHVEGETGILMDPFQLVNFGSDPAIFPSFQGRGYATLSTPALTVLTVQWTISIPQTADYGIVLKYSYPPIGGHTSVFGTTILLEKDVTMVTESLVLQLCFSPPCYIQSSPVNLEMGTWTVQFSIPTNSFAIEELNIVRANIA